MSNKPAQAAHDIGVKNAQMVLEKIAQEIEQVERESPLMKAGDFGVGVCSSVSIMVAQAFNIIQDAYGQKHALDWVVAVLGDMAVKMKAVHKINLAITMVRKEGDS